LIFISVCTICLGVLEMDGILGAKQKMYSYDGITWVDVRAGNEDLVRNVISLLKRAV
jgi:hypothetical protein